MDEQPCFKYTREKLMELILSAPQTRDGFYWCPDIRKKMFMTKKTYDKELFNDESKYIINRNYFTYKSFYAMKDLKYLLAQNEEKLFYEDWVKLNMNFEVDNEDLLDLPISAYVNGNKLSRVIDYYLFKQEYLLNI